MQPPMLNSLIRSFFMGCVLLSGLAGCASKAQRANDAYARAQQYLTYNNLRDAQRELVAAVAIRDDIPDIWRALGQVRLDSGDIPGSFTAFTRADELRPGDPDTLRSLAYTGYMVGASRQSQEATDRLLVLAPGDLQGLAVKGLLALDKRDTATALACAEAILAASPGDDSGLMLKARSIAVNGKLDDAIKMLETGLKTAPPNSGLPTALLQLYRAKGDIAGMQGLFPGLIARQKNNAELALDYVNLLYRTGKIDDARKLWSDTVIAHADDGPLMAWAFDVYDNAEPGAAPVILDDRIMRIRKSPLRSVAAQFLVTRREYARALKLLGGANDLADADRGLYAVALDGLGRHDEARAMVTAVLAGTTGPQDANALTLRARWAITTGAFDQANTDAQTAVIADPSNLAARLVLAQSYLAGRQPVRVRQVLADATGDLRNSRRALLAYLQFLQSAGDMASAVAAARTFADVNRAQPWSWSTMVAVCQKAKDDACVVAANKRLALSAHDFTFTNPARAAQKRGLFSPMPVAL